MRDRIVDAARLSVADSVLEIGPGLGALTERLKDAAANVVAVEIDRGLAALLPDLLSADNVRVVHADFLAVDLRGLIGDSAGWHVVANVPYYITTPIVARILESSFKSAVLMVQQEVADRLLARAGDPERGAISLLVENLTVAERVMTVPATCFYPKPKVSSTVVRLTRRLQPLASADPYAFRAVVRAAFGYRRKTLQRALREGLNAPSATVAEIIDDADLDPRVRGETLPLEAFDALALALPKRWQEGWQNALLLAEQGADGF